MSVKLSTGVVGFLSEADKIILEILFNDLDDQYACRGCNDIQWPKDWTKEEVDAYKAQMLLNPSEELKERIEDDQEHHTGLFPFDPRESINFDSDLLQHMKQKLGLLSVERFPCGCGASFPKEGTCPNCGCGAEDQPRDEED